MSEPSTSGADRNSLAARDARRVLRPWRGGGAPLAIARAEAATVYDDRGRAYLDCTSGYFVNNAGHCHPRVIEAAKAQLECVTQVSGRHVTEPAVALAERLVHRAPKTLDKVLFTTGGSEATEFALKMARQRACRPGVAAVEHGFHGLTLGALAASSNAAYRATAGVPLGEHVVHLPSPYCYRCPYESRCATQCLDEAERRLKARPHSLAAILAEPMQAAGSIIPPTRWWKRLDAIRRRWGALLILDEIQSGLGRTGRFFACEHYGLEPDILTAGKGISGGVGSLGAVLASNEVSSSFDAGTTPTSAANAVSAAAGAALIDALCDEGLIDHAAAMGALARELVEAIDDPWIGDIRLAGLFGGIELVLDRERRVALPRALVRAIKRGLQVRGVLITVSGPHANVLRLQPPLCITSGELEAFADALRGALAEVRERGAA